MKKLALLLALAMLLSCFGISAAAVSVTTVQAGLFNDNYETLADVAYCLVNVDAEKYPQLQKALSELFPPEADIRETLEQMAQDAAEWSEIFDYSVSHHEYRTVTPVRFDDAVLSLRLDYDGYTGGVHGYYSTSGQSFDTATGKELTISDLITDMDAWKQLVWDKLYEEYGEELFDPEMVQNSLALYSDENYSWFVDGIGLHLFFNPYEVASFAAGIQELIFPYDEYPELFNAQYAALPERRITPVPTGRSFPVKVNGETKSVTVEPEYDENWEICRLNVQVGKRCYSFPVMMYAVNLYLVTAENSSRIYALGSMENDYPVLYVLNPSDGSSAQYYLRQASSSNEWINEEDLYLYKVTEESFLDPDHLKLEARLQVLSTVGGQKDCRIDENAMLVVPEGGYRIGNDICFTTLLPMNAEVDGQITEIPVGTELKYLCTDGESWTELSLPDGRIAKVTIDAFEWPQYVSGLELECVFDGTFFAG